MRSIYKHTLINRSIKNWQTLLVLGLVSIINLTTLSCEKEPIDEYYVKYEVNSSTIYFNGKLDLTIKTEDNEDLTLIIDQRALHETIIGPVEKGFEASMSVIAQGNNFNQLRLYSNIYVSKNGSPFALKQSNGSDEPRGSLQLRYIIDY